MPGMGPGTEEKGAIMGAYNDYLVTKTEELLADWPAEARDAGIAAVMDGGTVELHEGEGWALRGTSVSDDEARALIAQAADINMLMLSGRDAKWLLDMLENIEQDYDGEDVAVASMLYSRLDKHLRRQAPDWAQIVAATDYLGVRA